MMASASRAVLLFAGILGVGCGGAPPQPQLIRAFTTSDVPITRNGVTSDEGGWRIERQAAGPVPLFEVPNPGVEYTTLA
jgi:hypothetical protein